MGTKTRDKYSKNISNDCYLFIQQKYFQCLLAIWNKFLTYPIVYKEDKVRTGDIKMNMFYLNDIN